MASKLFPGNVHAVERVARVLLGAVLIALAFVGPKTPWGFVGIVPLLTGLSGTCPAYTLFGFSTCRTTKG